MMKNLMRAVNPLTSRPKCMPGSRDTGENIVQICYFCYDGCSCWYVRPINHEPTCWHWQGFTLWEHAKIRSYQGHFKVKVPGILTKTPFLDKLSHICYPWRGIIYAAFKIRPSWLSETTKICGGQSIVTMRLSERTTNFWERYFHITLLFKSIYKWSDCQGWNFLLQWWASFHLLVNWCFQKIVGTGWVIAIYYLRTIWNFSGQPENLTWLSDGQPHF